jgi:hypothetical protein
MVVLGGRECVDGSGKHDHDYLQVALHMAAGVDCDAVVGQSVGVLPAPAPTPIREYCELKRVLLD